MPARLACSRPPDRWAVGGVDGIGAASFLGLQRQVMAHLFFEVLFELVPVNRKRSLRRSSRMAVLGRLDLEVTSA